MQESMLALPVPMIDTGPMSKPRGHTINGPVLRCLRLKVLNASIAEAAPRIGKTPSMWSKWELGGRRISDENLELLVDLFDLESTAPLLASTAFEAEAEAERQRERRNVKSVA